MQEKIKVKYFSDAYRLKSISNGDWVDLAAGEDVEVKAGELKLIPLGVAMRLPEGYEAIMAPRSSTFKKYGLLQANSIGVIDESYCGDGDQWLFPAYATRDVTIPAGTRIAQFRIIRHQPALCFEEVTALESEDRGGFGSTGD